MGNPEKMLASDSARSRWMGAEVLGPGERPRQAVGPTTFHIFRASSAHAVFAVADRPDSAVLPQCPGGGRWEPFKVVPETGKARIGFSEVEAKRDIARQGFHLVNVMAQAEEVTQ